MTNCTLRPSSPPASFVIASQTLYPCWAALPGSEKSPVSGSDAPILIGALFAVLVLPPPPPLLPPQPATTSAVAASPGASQRSLLIGPPPDPLQTFAEIDCDRSRRPAGFSSANPRSADTPGSGRRGRP